MQQFGVVESNGEGAYSPDSVTVPRCIVRCCRRCRPPAPLRSNCCIRPWWASFRAELLTSSALATRSPTSSSRLRSTASIGRARSPASPFFNRRTNLRLVCMTSSLAQGHYLGPNAVTNPWICERTNGGERNPSTRPESRNLTCTFSLK